MLSKVCPNNNDLDAYSFRCKKTICRKYVSVRSTLKTYFPRTYKLEIYGLILAFYFPNGYNAHELVDQMLFTHGYSV